MTFHTAELAVRCGCCGVAIPAGQTVAIVRVTVEPRYRCASCAASYQEQTAPRGDQATGFTAVAVVAPDAASQRLDTIRRRHAMATVGDTVRPA